MSEIEVRADGVKLGLRRARPTRRRWGDTMSDTWPNGVPYIDEDTRAENLRSTEALRDLIATLHLYIGRWHETQLTTEQKELLADVVDSAPRDFEAEPFDRWWQR